MLKCFEPLIDKNTRIMVIGTMPSVMSLDKNEYYAHPRNLFWKIISQQYNKGKSFADYAEKKSCLLNNGIGLWDNLQYCNREGSLDSEIKNAVPNDFQKLLRDYPKVKRLIFNGQKSYQFFQKYQKELLKEIECRVVPSTSPANASIFYEAKLSEWISALS